MNAEVVDSTAPVRSLLAPLNGLQMLLPNAVIAEVVAYTEPQAVSERQPWFIGNMPWRGRPLPLIAMETIVGQKMPAFSARGRVMVLAGLEKLENLPFYGVYCSGIPHLVQADRTSLSSVEQGVTSPSVLSQVQVNGVLSFIPNLELIEKALSKLVSSTASE